MTRIRFVFTSAIALVLIALSGPFAPAPAGAAPAAHPAPLSVSVLCEATGNGGFVCDAYPSGGHGLYTYSWTMLRNAAIKTNYGNTIFGRCTIDTYAAISVTVTDRIDSTTASDSRSFYCFRIAQ